VLRSHKKNVHPLSGNICDGQQSCSACCVASADIAHLSCVGVCFLHWAEMAYGSEIRMSTLSCTLACLTACELPIHLGNLTGKSKLLIFFYSLLPIRMLNWIIKLPFYRNKWTTVL
jgi:hypothetical protein